MEISVDIINSVAEEVESILEEYKALMLPYENADDEVEIAPELSVAFGDLAEVCRDFSELVQFYDTLPTKEENAARGEEELAVLKEKRYLYMRAIHNNTLKKGE